MWFAGNRFTAMNMGLPRELSGRLKETASLFTEWTSEW
jgi:hypothetical protein